MARRGAARQAAEARQEQVQPQQQAVQRQNCPPRPCAWLSFSARYLVNVEDLNNVEAGGNYVRHRRAPIVANQALCGDTTGGASGHSYLTVYAPAVSGEMIAHGYQMNLVEVAKRLNLPVDSLAEQGYLIKRGAGPGPHQTCQNINNPSEYEYCVIQNDVVEDVAGFLDPETGPTKRVSCVAFSYMVPPPEPSTLKAVATAPQFHVRYAPRQYQRQYQNLQVPYSIEVGSAPYVLTGWLDMGCIGCTQNRDDSNTCRCVDNIPQRREAALSALKLTLTQFLFGAKRTRFNPIVQPEAFALAVSEMPFNLRPVILCNGFETWLREEAYRALKFKESLSNIINKEIYIIYWNQKKVNCKDIFKDMPDISCETQPQGQGSAKVRLVEAMNPEDVFVKAKEVLVERSVPGQQGIR